MHYMEFRVSITVYCLLMVLECTFPRTQKECRLPATDIQDLLLPQYNEYKGLETQGIIHAVETVIINTYFPFNC